MSELNMYTLSRAYWDFSFANPELVNTNTTSVFFFAIEHCNRLGWKDKFGLPSSMAMEATGIKNWRTYSKAFNDLIENGFIKLIQKSTNQHSSNIIAIVLNTKAPTKALDKAMQKHSQKQHTKHSQSTVCIDKPLYNNTIIQDTISFDVFWNLYDKKVGDKIKLTKKWKSLKDEERQAAMIHIPKYKIAQPEKTYRKDPSTYLNNKSFNDEIISLTTAPPPMNYNGQMQQPVKRDYRSEMFKNKNGNWEHPELGVVSIDYVHLGKTAAELSEMCQRGELD